MFDPQDVAAQKDSSVAIPRKRTAQLTGMLLRGKYPIYQLSERVPVVIQDFEVIYADRVAVVEGPSCSGSYLALYALDERGDPTHELVYRGDRLARLDLMFSDIGFELI